MDNSELQDADNPAIVLLNMRKNHDALEASIRNLKAEIEDLKTNGSGEEKTLIPQYEESLLVTLALYVENKKIVKELEGAVKSASAICERVQEWQETATKIRKSGDLDPSEVDVGADFKYKKKMF